jgi:hypothetical protein
MRPIFSTNLNKSLSQNEIELSETDLTIYPNPFSDHFEIRTSDVNFAGVYVFDINGKLLLTSDEQQRTFDMNNFSKGIYLVKDIYTGKTFKLIKN